MLKLAGSLLAGFLFATAALAQGVGIGVGVDEVANRGSAGQPGVPAPGANFDFVSNSFSQAGTPACVSAATCLTVTASNGTNLLPTAAAGASFTAFPANTARTLPGQGIIVEESRSNFLLNSSAPATQTTPSLTCTAPPGCTLWVNGSGSATPSAGTATGCSGFAAATNGNPDVFSCTGTGTIVVTVSGLLNEFQLEVGGFATSYIPATSAPVTRANDIINFTVTPTIGAASSIFAAGTPAAPAASNNAEVSAIISDGTLNNRMGPFRSNVNGFANGIITNASANTALSAVLWPQGTAGKTALAAANAAQTVAFNGNLATATAAWPPVASLTTISIGSNVAQQFWNGTISRVTLWPTTALTSAQLQQITQ